jgi:hypothetical protein
MRIHLGGHLSWYDPEKRAWLDVAQPEPATPRAVAERLGVPLGEIAIVTVNRVLVHLEEVLVSDGDTLEFYSPVGGG